MVGLQRKTVSGIPLTGPAAPLSPSEGARGAAGDKSPAKKRRQVFALQKRRGLQHGRDRGLVVREETAISAAVLYLGCSRRGKGPQRFLATGHPHQLWVSVQLAENHLHSSQRLFPG